MLSLPKILEKVLPERFLPTSTKRRKTGVGENDWRNAEDDWCDALNDLTVESSSSDEYLDARADVDRSSRKRKKVRYKKHATREKMSESSDMLPSSGPARPKLSAVHRTSTGSSNTSGLSRCHQSDPGFGTEAKDKPNPVSSFSTFLDNRTKSSDQKKPSSYGKLFQSGSFPFIGGMTFGFLQKRKATVTLMTSSQLFTMDGLKKKLEKLKNSRHDLIEKVKVLQLPYNRLQLYTFTEPVDVMILCHSVENRGFAITNVKDSLYNEFLDYCHKELGKERIVVVAHDFPPEEHVVREKKMSSFRHNQPSTFEKAGLVIISGMMDKEPEMRQEDWDSLVKFLGEASKSTPTKDAVNSTLPEKRVTVAIKSNSNQPEPKAKQNDAVNSTLPEKRVTVAIKSNSNQPEPKAKQSGKSSHQVLSKSRKPVIYICTSYGLHSVEGLRDKLQTLSRKYDYQCDIKEVELPYSNLKDFRFPLEVDKNDAMILCHSVQNRGLSITDVPNSIYDEYLKLCYEFFGKDHVAIIVHDFKYSQEMLHSHMDTFRRTQSKTFEFADFVAFARKLDTADVQLSQEDLINLDEFVGRMC